jgi:hypothetical protein
VSDAIGNHVSHWHVSDTHFEACGCAVICPCRKQRGVRAGMRSTGTVPTIVPETRQNSVSRAYASQLARSLMWKRVKDLRGKMKMVERRISV